MPKDIKKQLHLRLFSMVLAMLHSRSNNSCDTLDYYCCFCAQKQLYTTRGNRVNASAVKSYHCYCSDTGQQKHFKSPNFIYHNISDVVSIAFILFVEDSRAKVIYNSCHFLLFVASVSCFIYFFFTAVLSVIHLFP